MAPDGDAAQTRVNNAVWAARNFVSTYEGRNLRPAEVILLVRYRDALTGRVLELGCGAGRLTGYFAQLGGDVHAIDLSPTMVEYCRSRYPDAAFSVRDLRDLSPYESDSFDAVVAEYNVLDVLDESDRRQTLREIHRILKPEGLLLMSSHNRAYVPRVASPLQRVVHAPDPLRLAYRLARLPIALRNRRRLATLERNEERYAIVNDEAHDYRLLHYYIGRDDEARELAEQGLELVECLDSDGRRVPEGDDAREHSELHYVARRPRSGGAATVRG